MIGEKILCGLDVGSQRLKAGVVKVTSHEHCELLGVYEMPTMGFVKSSVSDLGDLTECIQSTLANLSKKIGFKLKDIQLGIGGDLIDTHRSRAIIPLSDRGNKVVAALDVKKVNTQARLLGIKMDEDLLHEFAQSYEIDGVNSALNPLGLYARKLEVDMLLVIAHLTSINNISKAVNQAGYEVANVFFTSFAASEISLTRKAKIDGVALIDIGASVTDVLIFKDGILRIIEKIPLGGEDVTRNIAHNLQLSFDLAEDIKKSYGMAFSADQNEQTRNQAVLMNKEMTEESHAVSSAAHVQQQVKPQEGKFANYQSAQEEILVKNDKGYFPIKRKVIYESIEPDIDQLVAAIEQCMKGPFYNQLNGGIVIVGGGSLLPGLLERIEKNTRLPVRMGKVNIASMQLNNGAIFTAAIGLAKMGFTKTLAYTLSKVDHGSWVKNFSARLRELYQEYF